ncbi:MAG: NAD(P)-dependent oxidoreductase [Gammaproteobacteria bacterium]|nr:NAD(P)-dependent oxidoreductase [Gammaproteobacteria bacterium]
MRILLIGSNGQVGREIGALLQQQAGVECLCLDRQSLDLQNISAIKPKLAAMGNFDWIINTSAYTAVDKAEAEMHLADAVNHLAVREIAQFAFERNSRVLHFSTDYVFAGTAKSPYTETSVTQPLNVYGQTKLAGEKALQTYQPDHLIIRTSWVFSVHGHNFLKTILRLLKTKTRLEVVGDQHGIPTAAKDLARVSWDLLNKNTNAGTYHYCSGEPTTWYGFASYIKESMLRWGNVMCQEIKSIKTREYPTPAQRPLYSVLNTAKIQAAGIILQPWQNSVDEVIDVLLREKVLCEK